MSHSRRRSHAPGSHASLRNANQRRVLDVLRAGKADYTQAELARLTGLAPATISNIVRDLTALRLVQADAGSGRRGSSVRLSHESGLVAGVDFGHSHLGVAIGTLTGEIVAEERHLLRPAHAYDGSLALAASLIAELAPDHAPVMRVAMGLPAPIAGGVVRGPHILPGWHGTEARDRAAEIFGIPVELENDANLGALAEHRRGAAQGRRSSFFIKISSGVGAGIVHDDQLFHGAIGTAGELGHITLNETGPLCRCGGRGCLEAYTSINSIMARTEGRVSATTFDELIAAARAGEVVPRGAIEDAGLHLGWGLAGVVNLINPEVLVIGGDIARAGDLLLESVAMGVRRHALDVVAQTPVVIGALADRASLVGAVLLAAERTELSLDPPV
ncbi:ROK family protein [Nocardioides sp. Kera G14]|uniref:ROK family protein n=1 Tax=Nocardioides sp. Kera G14 TaxID=2884264 RepID=UPI001D1175D2|nr:ROK family transcriptional regulator [Nocardioides sp. Kera G14]UDY24357.1 ROK family transcriptional regulator [Nocardioides sp. Kera G14]